MTAIELEQILTKLEVSCLIDKYNKNANFFIPCTILSWYSEGKRADKPFLSIYSKNGMITEIRWYDKAKITEYKILHPKSDHEIISLCCRVGIEENP